MAHTINWEIKNKDILRRIVDDDIVMQKRIADLSDVYLVSNRSTITFKENFDGNTQVLANAFGDILCRGEINGNASITLISQSGGFTLEGEDHSQKNINSQTSLDVSVNRDAIIHGDLNSECTVSIKTTNGGVTIKGDLNEHTRLTVIARGDIVLEGDINSDVRVKLTSTHGNVRIRGHVNSNPVVRIDAFQDVYIGHEVNGNLSLRIHAGGNVQIGGEIGNNALVEAVGMTGVTINGSVKGHSIARLAVVSGSITLHGNIEDHSGVNFWPASTFMISGSGATSSSLLKWTEDLFPATGEDIAGSWWNNWLWSYGYVSSRIYVPQNYQELLKIVRGMPADGKLKAVGGGWSASDMTLPVNSGEAERLSLALKGKDRHEDLRYVLRNMADKNTPMDLFPNQVADLLSYSTAYDQSHLRKTTQRNLDLPSLDTNKITIETRELKSSLQHQLRTSRIEHSDGKPTYYFWVEAGITMSELTHLLDHQYPRLAIEASGGSPGATLAGTISSATHGGEFQKPLLIDRIKAIHLIAPGGVEWWIEGDDPVMDAADLHHLYGPQLRIINRSTELPHDLKGLHAQDILRTVVVSMGAIGVIYSVVLEVVEQFSIQQITKKIGSWTDLLNLASTNASELNDRRRAANRAIFDVLINGSLNGTGIRESENQYVDLATNPFNQSCWVVNRRFLPRIAVDAKDNGDLIGGYAASLSRKLTEGVDTSSVGGQLGARFLDFLSLPRDVPGLAALAIFDANALTKFFSGIQNSPMLLSNALALLQAKAFWNHTHETDYKRSYGFMEDVLEAILDALQGTYDKPISDITGLSFEVGAIGWPNDGIPGRGFEVALNADCAFSYLQKVLDILKSNRDHNRAFMGYLSTRICPQTQTLMGMQQFDKTVMVEIVAHRTPEANQVFDDIVKLSKSFNLLQEGLDSSTDTLLPTFHWGLETEWFDNAHLQKTILNQAYRSGSALTRLQVFKLVKTFLSTDKPLVFDNSFVKRMGL